MTFDEISAVAFGGVALLASGWCAWSWRDGDKESATDRDVLAWSAAQRAQQGEADGTPPGGREPAPDVAPAPPVHLATVTDITARRAA
ncbi:hypothetical protein C7C46_12330 [Streptomyces tateyamensis]|uniref:Uncharacterized protein n=1 Tax=Streptomyces tateyamensis TaxID=565073 RepID=A0A2V4N7R8_9ACTN|nr:hypothetical protein [Streptomyces tateyamensis]PYC80486.1 hypothetical protein C7C46_12330 [Streptomyces tateyamensis]